MQKPGPTAQVTVTKESGALKARNTINPKRNVRHNQVDRPSEILILIFKRNPSVMSFLISDVRS